MNSTLGSFLRASNLSSLNLAENPLIALEYLISASKPCLDLNSSVMLSVFVTLFLKTIIYCSGTISDLPDCAFTDATASPLNNTKSTKDIIFFINALYPNGVYCQYLRSLGSNQDSRFQRAFAYH